MLIYGSNATHLKSAQSETEACPSCGTMGSLVLNVFSRYAHLFWIPVFPFSKVGASQCQHCKHTMEAKEMPSGIKREFDILKSDTKSPIWQFSGLALIAVLITWIIIESKEDTKNELLYLSAPEVDDVYEYRVDRDYSTLKVIGITQDSVYVSPNEYITNKMSGINDIDLSGNYSEYSYGISRDDLKAMYDENNIVNINRQ